MARDGLSIRLENGVAFDKILAKMAVTTQSGATKVVNQSLTKGAAELRKSIKKATPKDSGQLRRSVKSGVRRKVNLGRNTFLAGVWFNNKRFGNAKDNADGWYAPMVIKRHKANAFGYKGGDNFVTPAVKRANSSVRKIIGTTLAMKIAELQQKLVNKLK